ncbi:MAG: sigma 54-interacting transcriptional regulator [Candidatus Zhuqueibacterota bacterium]
MTDQNSHTTILLNLARFSEELVPIRDCEKALDYILDAVSETIGCNQASLMMFDFDAKNLKLMKVRGFKADHYKPPRIELTENVEKWIYEGGEVFALTEQGMSKFLIVFDEDEAKYFYCELRIPIFVLGRLLGILNIGKKSDGTEYSNEDITLLRIFVNISSIAIEKCLRANETLSARTMPGSEEKATSVPPKIRIRRRVEGSEMIGRSPAMQKIRNLIDRVAGKDVTVLITGESGTGKELVARDLHEKSLRKDKPLITMNCAALPENLVESELFGHEKGAFTGAHSQKIGKFEFADGATLFLDEIGDMSLTTQSKLLRVLQEGTFQRIGGNRTLKSDVRVIAATNKDLSDEIKKGTFREDLYYRINVMQIHIPPLRERKEDIPLLAEYFFKKYIDIYCKQIKKISDYAMNQLMEYQFPGNVREFQNLIERAVIMEQSDELALDFLPGLSSKIPMVVAQDSNGTLEELEKEHIERVIKQVNYNKSQAARILGIARKTLREKMQRYGLS